MFEKIKILGIIWIGVIITYLFIAFTHDVGSSFATMATDEMASQNLSSEIVGIEEAIGSFNFWKWPIPALVGIVASAVTLREEIINRVRR